MLLIKQDWIQFNFQTSHQTFKGERRKAWEISVEGSVFKVNDKLKSVKRALSAQSKVEYENFFKKIATLEDVVKMKEVQLEMNLSEENKIELRKEIAELRRFQKIEKEYWKQKAGMQQFKKGDKNSKFFHAYVKDRRKRLRIQKIEDNQGRILETEQEIGGSYQYLPESISGIQWISRIWGPELYP